MKSTLISTYVPRRIAEWLVVMAREQGVSVSRQAAKILEQYYQDVSQRRQDVPLLTKKDLDRAERHISGTFENLDDLIRHVNENAIRPKNDASL